MKNFGPGTRSGPRVVPAEHAGGHKWVNCEPHTPCHAEVRADLGSGCDGGGLATRTVTQKWGPRCE